MRIAFLTVAVLIAGLAVHAVAQDTDPSAPAGLTLKWEAPDPGSVQAIQSASELSYEVAIKDETGQVRRRSQLSRISAQKKTVMTLAIAERVATKVLVRYQEWKSLRIVGEQRQIVDGPGVGEAFVVENRTGEDADLDVRTLDGKGLVRREGDEIAADNANHVGSIPALQRMLDGKAVRKGDKIIPTAEQAAAIFGEGYQSAHYIYNGTRSERGMNCIVLQVAIHTKTEMPNGSVLDINRNGEILLMADTLWPVSLELNGPVTVSGGVDHPQLGKLSFGGEGKSTVSNTFNYSADMMPTSAGVTMEPGTAKRPTLHDFTCTLLDGTEKKLSDFKGKVVLVVNVASKCGFTPHYTALQALHAKYGDRFVVLGFPCNDFNNQEPGTADEIRQFCEETYKVTFPLFAKMTLKPEDRLPLYDFLHRSTGTLPQWNFFKYLVDANGDVVAVWDPRTAPDRPEVAQAIEEVIAGKHLEAGDDNAGGE